MSTPADYTGKFTAVVLKPANSAQCARHSTSSYRCAPCVHYLGFKTVECKPDAISQISQCQWWCDRVAL